MAGRNAVVRFAIDDGDAKQRLEALSQGADKAEASLTGMGKARMDQLRRELEGVGAGAAKAGQGAESAGRAVAGAGKQAAAATREWNAFERSIPGSAAALERFTLVQQKADAALAEGRISAQQHGVALTALQKRYVDVGTANDNATGKTSKFAAGMQQAGFQVGDFAAQVGGGTSAFVAFGQQAGQLLGVFGVWGAVAGAAVTVASMLAANMTSAGDAASGAGTSYTDYGKGLEAAKKASDALNLSLGDSKAALKAQAEQAVASRVAMLQKAEADLAAAEAAIMSSLKEGDIEGAGTTALLNIFQSGKVKELRQEVIALRDATGQYDDAVTRLVRSQARQEAGQIEAGKAIEAQRQQIRETIVQLGLETKGQDLSSAGKLRARLETEALTKAQAAGRSKIDDLTQGLINQAVTAQEQVDKLQASENATKKAGTAADTLAKQRAEVVAELDRDIAAQQRLADALGLGADAQRAANTETKIAEALAKAKTTADTAEGKVIAEKVRKVEGLRNAQADLNALTDSKQQLAYAEAELSLMGQAEPYRERALKTLSIQQQAMREFKSTTSDTAVQWIALQEKIADTQAITAFRQEVDGVSRDIATDLAQKMFEQGGSILDWWKNLLKRMAIEIASTQFIMPVVRTFVSEVPGLFGLTQPTGTPPTGATPTLFSGVAA